MKSRLLKTTLKNIFNLYNLIKINRKFNLKSHLL